MKQCGRDMYIKRGKIGRLTSTIEIFVYTGNIWCKSATAFAIDINKKEYMAG